MRCQRKIMEQLKKNNGCALHWFKTKKIGKSTFFCRPQYVYLLILSNTIEQTTNTSNIPNSDRFFLHNHVKIKSTIMRKMFLLTFAPPRLWLVMMTFPDSLFPRNKDIVMKTRKCYCFFFFTFLGPLMQNQKTSAKQFNQPLRIRAFGSAFQSKHVWHALLGALPMTLLPYK